MMNSSVLLFLTTLVTGSLIAISSTTWLGVWMGLEMNLLSFIPLMAQSSKFSAEAALKYFLTQALASAVLLLGIVGLALTFNQSGLTAVYSNLIMAFALLMKMGAAPTHFWFPEVSNGLSWASNMILMTWQKIAPFIALMYLMLPLQYLTLVIALSAIAGAAGGFNQTSLRKILAYSSINHMAWMLVAVIAGQSYWTLYFLTYSVMTLVMMNFFNMSKINNLTQLADSSKKNFLESFLISLNMLSMGGLPPFLGFMPKWMIMEFMMCNDMSGLAMLMIGMTLVVLYFYLRLTYSTFMFFNSTLKLNYSLPPSSNPLLVWFSVAGLLVSPMLMFT